MSALGVYRSKVDPAWIDYNGHLNDACYGLIGTKALDHLLDYLDLGAANRERTNCTMYTLESHINYLAEVMGTDEVWVHAVVLDFDSKRLQVGLRMDRAHSTTTAATMDVLLLHVQQGGAKPNSAPFSAEATARIRALQMSQGDSSSFAPRSRKIELTRR